MKIGNIRKVVENVASKYREVVTLGGNNVSERFENTIKELPKSNLEEWFQKRYNKNLDYDQWVGIREELEKMGRILYEKTLTIIGDSVFIIQGENQTKIEELELQVKDLTGEKERLENELEKYID